MEGVRHHLKKEPRHVYYCINLEWYLKRVQETIKEFRMFGKEDRVLVEKVIEYFKSWGLDTAVLWGGDNNTQALEVYKSLGFEDRDRFNYWIRMT